MSSLRPRLQPADRRLLALLRASARDATGEAAAAELGRTGEDEGPSWGEVLARARAHRVEPQALWTLAHLPAGTLSRDVQSEVQRRRRAWILRGLGQEQTLARACRRLAADGIFALVLKGAALGRFAYGDPARRSSADLDLLVPAGSHTAALEILSRDGWHLRDRAQSTRYHRPHHYHDVLVDAAGNILELHWHLSRSEDLFRLDPEDFRRNAVETDGGLRYSAPTDLLLHTAAQALGEGFSRLLRVADADGLLRRQRRQIDWERLVHQARAGRLAPALWLIVTLAGDLLRTPEPPRALWRPPAPTRLALMALEPATSLASSFAARHSSLRQLYAFWLADGHGAGCRAFVRIFRRPSQERARWPSSGPARWRLALRGLLGGVKLAGYQVLALARMAGRRG